jgi:hypothetical protein
MMALQSFINRRLRFGQSKQERQRWWLEAQS